MNRSLVLAGLLVTVLYGGGATATDSGPYLIGHWKLHDSFTDGGALATPIVTDDTVFVFLNPTPLTLALEYAFFDSDGSFCGCDRDTLKPNGRVRYTMTGEQTGGQFFCHGTPTNAQTDGTMKTLVFIGTKPTGNLEVGDAVQAGYQIDVFPGGRTQSDLNAVPLSDQIEVEMLAIHRACNDFIH